MGKFKKGDTVKIIKVIDDVGHFKVGDILIWDCPEPGGCIEASHELAVKRGAPAIDPTYYKFKKIGGTMNKYEELKERIGEVEGWTKDADDILNEITKGGSYYVQVNNYRLDASGAYIKFYDAHNTFGSCFKEIKWTNQCDKNEAFKEGLMWFLDNSDIAKEDKAKDNKKEKLQEKLDKIQEEIDAL